MSEIDITLIITTYNWPQALQACLESVMRQSKLPSEVIIADDGSSNETKLLIDHYKNDFPIPLLHVWQEDNGYRRSAILNKALRKVDPKHYVIFIDGDIILHRHFIADHARLAQHGYYVFGRRSFLSAELSTKILSRKKPTKLSCFTKGLRRRDNAFYLPWLTPITQSYRRNKNYGIGCNLAAWMTDLIKVNGMNEQMTGWGCEDNDLIQRLRNIGLVSKAAKYQAIEFHIYHKIRPANEENKALLQKVIESHSQRCEFGLEYPP